MIIFSDEKFTKPLSEKITDYIQRNNVHFDYPAFIHKKDSTEPNRSYKKLITYTDLIGGVILRHYHERSFSKTYSLIEKHSKGVILKADKDKWHWDNVMCLPSKEAYEDIKHIMGPPSYVKNNW